MASHFCWSIPRKPQSLFDDTLAHEGGGDDVISAVAEAMAKSVKDVIGAPDIIEPRHVPVATLGRVVPGTLSVCITARRACFLRFGCCPLSHP